MKFWKFSKREKKKIWGEIRWRLITSRKENNLTQKEVARSKIISQSRLSKLENGKLDIDLITLAELATLYDEELSYFIPELLQNLNKKLEHREYG